MSLPPSNNHNVYIVGAGFSKSAGLPVVKDFLNRMRDALEWLPREQRLEEKTAIEDVLRYRLKAASAAYWAHIDLENIEQLFSLASATEDPVSSILPTAVAATLDFARKHGTDRTVQVGFQEQATLARFFKHMAFGNEWTPNAPKVFKNISNATREGRTTFKIATLLGMLNEQGTPSGQNSFISFNHDTLIEDALTRLEVPWSYGFGPQGPVWSGSCTDNSWGRSADENAIPLLKLHGSVNWGEPTNDAQADDGHTARQHVFGSYEELRQAGAKPRIVPPTWSKGRDEIISDQWKEALKRLKTATRVIIIGFSMPETDLHFRYLLAAGLQENIWLRSILFVNPMAEKLATQAGKILNSRYIDEGLIRFIPVSGETFADWLARGTTISANDETIDIDIGRSVKRAFICNVFDRNPLAP